MIVKMRTTAAGPEGIMLAGKCFSVGDEIGKDWMTRGYAVKPPAKFQTSNPIRAEKNSREEKE